MKIKKLLSLALGATMLVSLAACNFGGGKKEKSAVEEVLSSLESGEGIYKEVSKIELPEGVKDVYNIFTSPDGTVYMYSTDYHWDDYGFDEDIMPYDEPMVKEPSWDAVIEENTGEPTEEVEEVVEDLVEPVGDEEPVDGAFEPVDDSLIDGYGYGGEDPDAPAFENNMTFTLYKTDVLGTGVTQVTSFDMPTACSIYNAAVDNDGNLVLLVNEWAEDNEETYVAKYAFNGSELCRYVFKPEPDSDYVSINYLAIDKDGNLGAAGAQSIYVLDKNLKQRGSQTLDGNAYINGLVVDKNGVLTLIGEDPVTYMPVIYEVGADASLTQVGSLDTYVYGFTSAPCYDFVVGESGNIKGYDKATGEFTQIFDCVASDVDPSSLNKFVVTDQTHAIVIVNDSNFMPELYVYEQVDPSTLAQKEIITLGCFYLDGNISRKVIEFNKKSDTTKIVVVDYSKYEEVDNPGGGTTRLKNDIASKNCPDLLVLGGGQISQIKKYAEKKAFVDLNEMLANDPDLSAESFLPNIIQICTTGDQLSFLSPSFYEYTYAVKESVYNKVGGDTSLANIDAVEALCSDKAITSINSSDVLWSGIYYDMGSYIDLETGKCEFDSDQFRRLMAYAKSYPSEYPDYDYEEWNMVLKRDKSAFYPIFIDNFTNLNRQEQELFGENAVCVGFPSQGGSGAFVSLDNCFAISAKTEHKDECWQFMRYFFLPEYQTSDSIWNMPTTNVGVDYRIDAAMHRPFYIDYETGKKVEYDDYYYIGDKEVMIKPMTQERADYYKNYIISITDSYYYDDEIMKIVSEEAAPFFTGDKTADEVAKIIQSRVSIYVKEQR